MKGAADRLIALMAQERAALRAGDSRRLQALAPAKARLIAMLEANTPRLSAPEIDRLRAEAERTARLFRAAIGGVTQAIDDIARLRDRDERVYQRDGTRDAMGQTTPTMARRA